MNNLNLNASTYSNPNFQNSDISLKILADVAIRQLDKYGHSVESHNLNHPVFYEQRKNHDTHGRPLNHFSTSSLPHTESKLVPVKPLSKNEQWDPTKNTPDSFCSGKTVALKPGKAEISGLNNAKQAKPVTSKSNKVTKQAKYAITDKGIAARLRYYATAKGKRLKAISNTRNNVRRAAEKKGYNPELVNQIADLAAKIKKEILLSGTPFIFSLTKLMEILQSQQHENHVTDGRPLNHFLTSYLPHTQSKLVPVKPLSNNEQWNSAKEIPESFCFGKTVAPEPGKAHILALDNTNQTKKQGQPFTSKTNGVTKQTKYARTAKGKEARARYLTSAKAKELAAISNARKNAKQAAVKKGYSPELVKQIVDLAGEKKKETLLSGARFRFPVTKLKEMIQSQQQDQRISKK